MASDKMAKQSKSSSWGKINGRLHWGGPVVLTALGVVWTLQGFHMLPAFLDVPWLGLILLSLGLVRIGMYFRGFY